MQPAKSSLSDATAINQLSNLAYLVMGMGTEGARNPYVVTVAANPKAGSTAYFGNAWQGDPIASSGYSLGVMQYDFGAFGNVTNTSNFAQQVQIYAQSHKPVRGNFKSLLLVWATALLSMNGSLVNAQTQQNLNVVSALAARSGYGEELNLPDGSVIKTVWPTALCMADSDKEPAWPNTPCSPECEPFIYSVARVMPDGKQLWAKSYIGRSREFVDACDAYKFGFTIKTGMFNYKVSGRTFYVSPYGGTFVLGKIHFNADTGETVGKPPPNFTVVDAAWLRQVKEKIWSDAIKRFPDMPFANYDPKQIQINKRRQAERTLLEKNRYELFFDEVEKAVFALSTINKK